MWLTSLSLSNFRNIARQEITLPRGTTLFVGSNAQGKTSVLEAIYYIATFASFQTNTDSQLIHFAEQANNPAVARILADYEKSGQKHRLEVRVIVEANAGAAPRTRKEVLIDGVKKSPADVIGAFTAVLFIPQMFSIMEAGPDVRRRYLNLTLAQSIPGYARALSKYSKVLTQRNALLKALAERGGDPAQLEYWNTQLIEVGSGLVYHRARSLEKIEAHAASIHSNLSAGKEKLQFGYMPRLDHRQARIDPLPGCSLEDVRERLQAGIKACWQDEIRRGVTLVGPHRDDLRILDGGIDLGEFGSRGQLKTALLSMKLAEYQWMKEETQDSPVVLLDEVTSEIDVARRNALMRELGAYDQALLTATDADTYSADFISHSRVFQIANGQIINKQHPTT